MYILRKGLEYFFPKIDEKFMNKVIEIFWWKEDIFRNGQVWQISFVGSI